MSSRSRKGARALAAEQAEQLRELIAALPKIELHRHLPGSLRTQTIIDLADEYGFELPSRDPKALRPYVQVMPDTPPDLGLILRTLGNFQRRCFISPRVLSRLTYEMVEDAHAEGIVYLEVRFSPLTMAGDALTFDEVMEGIGDGLSRSRKAFPVRTAVLLGMTRTSDLGTCERIADLALAHVGEGLVTGVDLAGDEAVAPARVFEALFERIHSHGRLGITIHAGEAAGPESVRDAIERLGAQRIGHGLRAIHDQEVVDLVREQGVVLETCPVSNVLTGAVPAMDQHPLPNFLRADVAATINSDDPSWFDTTLNREYEVALTELGLSFAELQQAVLNAVQGAFLLEEERAELAATIERAYQDAAPRFEAILNRSQ